MLLKAILNLSDCGTEYLKLIQYFSPYIIIRKSDVFDKYNIRDI